MKTLSRSKLSYYAFGGASLSSYGAGYGFGPIEKEQDLLHLAFDLGVNTYDTAPFYGYGQSELTLGEFSQNKREKIFLINKGGLTWDQNKRFDVINTCEVYEKMLSESLKRLKTDFLDLYLVHHSSKEDIRYVAEFLVKKKEKGIIRYLGYCNLNLEEVKKFHEIILPDAVQYEVNLIRDVSQNLLDFIQKAYFFSWGPFSQGLLTGSWGPFHELDARSKAPWWKKRYKKNLIEKLKNIQKTKSLVEINLEYLKSKKYINSILIGFKSEQQLKEILLREEKVDPLFNDFLEKEFSDVRTYT